VMTATRATVNPPTPGTMWATNEAHAATRLTIASVLICVDGGANGPGGTCGTVVDGAACWPTTWVDEEGGA
jgi:hypothetical protein